MIWDILSKACSATTGHKIQIHLFHVMYNQDFKGIGKDHNKELGCLIQEIKRNIVYRRFQRETKLSLNNIIYDNARITAHLIIVCEKMLSLRKYQGKNILFYQNLINALKETM